jgi:hypothetical protein
MGVHWIRVSKYDQTYGRPKKATSSTEKDLGVKHKTNSTTKCVKFNDCARTRPRSLIGTTTINTNSTNEMSKPSARRGNKGKSKSKNKRERDDQEHNGKIKR